MTFGEAIEALKVGNRVARASWHGTKMWLGLFAPHNGSDMTSPYIAEALGDVPPVMVPWVASHADMLAEDWFIPETTHTDEAIAL